MNMYIHKSPLAHKESTSSKLMEGRAGQAKESQGRAGPDKPGQEAPEKGTRYMNMCIHKLPFAHKISPQQVDGGEARPGQARESQGRAGPDKQGQEAPVQGEKGHDT